MNFLIAAKTTAVQGSDTTMLMNGQKHVNKKTDFMITKKLDTKELFAALDDTMSHLLQVVSSLDEKELNTIPDKDKWTAGQLAEHLVKSNVSIAQALTSAGGTTEREPDERVQELKTMFLDFTVKFNAADSLLPSQEKYNKETLIADVKRSINDLKEAGNKAHLSEAINPSKFGEITKFELLHLAVYHTQRHIEQMKDIFRKA